MKKIFILFLFISLKTLGQSVILTPEAINKQNSAIDDITIQSYGTYPSIIGLRANGTVALPTALPSGEIIMQVGVRGYNGTGFSTSRANIRFKTTQTWTSTANGSSITFETSELNPYIVSDFLNVFYHKKLPGYYGYAYAIPNTFLSMIGGANLRAILGHEMGHCLGLYHTFETWDSTAKEYVARTGICKNCETNGDVLCDTPADDNGGVNASCVYIGTDGTDTDACSTPASYSPLTNNMMAYGDYNCLTSITNGQGERMRLFLTTNTSLMPFVSQDNLFIPVSGNYTVSSGTGYTLARDYVTVSEGSTNMTVNGTTNYSFQAKRVLLKSGTKFSPTVSGKVLVKSNPYCN